jgi:hypothetical protein
MPSKKFIIVVLAILLLGAGAFWLSNNNFWRNGSMVFDKQQGVLMPFQQNSANSDWEQVLEKIGVYSGVDKNLLSNQTASADSQPINETEKLSQAFLTQYLLAKQNAGGNSLATSTKEDLINSLIAGIDLSSPAYYKLSDLKISDDNSQTAVRNYGNRLITIVKSYNNPAPGDEISVFEEMIKNNDESMTPQLDKSVSTYDGLRKDILSMVVPSEIKTQHLKLVNSFAFFKTITEKLRDYFTDPMAGFIAAKQYQTAATDYADSLTEINNFLKNKLK